MIRCWAAKFFITGPILTLLSLASYADTASGAATEWLENYDAAKHYYPGERWQQLRDPGLAGWNGAHLAEIRNIHKQIGTDAALIVHRGIIIYSFGEISSKYQLYSIRKSLMSLLIGTEVDAGRLRITQTIEDLGIEDKPALTASERSASVEHLLTSRSGVYHPAAFETPRMRERRPKRSSAKPGERWYYNNWDFNALVTVFNRSSPQDFFEAFEARVADSLGMEYFSVKDTEYRYELEKSQHPAYLFKMSALDLARIGLLYLRGGDWLEDTVVSKRWIIDSTRVSHAWNNSDPRFGYGYMWHVKDYGYYAAGNGGQRIYVFPDYDLVLVHLVDRSSGKRVDGKQLRRINGLLLRAHPDRSCTEISVCRKVQ
ncbi:beta-lactamase family protein [Microbulbifer sp. CAU 1566]|uniref:serine hydrolase domain-containing protein n=1 Tax=Microbulbifer sp. CAU 1566 TaxID=2933269 RepID=UPI002006104E|nr:serine hydrolase [Microbulbifer sp. CAU 1566]MCK7597607.1 beta-lactamase family protein [Microbulbifer sp. CAU 1566]